MAWLAALRACNGLILFNFIPLSKWLQMVCKPAAMPGIHAVLSPVALHNPFCGGRSSSERLATFVDSGSGGKHFPGVVQPYSRAIATGRGYSHRMHSTCCCEKKQSGNITLQYNIAR